MTPQEWEQFRRAHEAAVGAFGYVAPPAVAPNAHRPNVVICADCGLTWPVSQWQVVHQCSKRR